MRHHLWIPNRYRPALPQVYVSPEAHIFIRRCRVPVDPIDPQVALRLRNRLDRDHIYLGMAQEGSHIEFIRPVSSRNLLLARNPAAIHPDVRAVVNAVKIEPDAAPSIILRKAEFGSVPPGTPKWAVLWHWQRREILADRIGGARNGSKILAKVGLGRRLVRDKRRDDRRRHGYTVPIIRAKPRCGNSLPARFHLA